MPCFSCSTRQTDPARGASPWRRAVVGGEQVLVCPDCQARGVDAELDRCAACGSRRLAKALGDVVCQDCGRHGPGVVAAPPGHDAGTFVRAAGDSGAARDLSDEVAAAIERVLDRGPPDS